MCRADVPSCPCCTYTRPSHQAAPHAPPAAGTVPGFGGQGGRRRLQQPGLFTDNLLSGGDDDDDDSTTVTSAPVVGLNRGGHLGQGSRALELPGGAIIVGDFRGVARRSGRRLGHWGCARAAGQELHAGLIDVDELARRASTLAWQAALLAAVPPAFGLLATDAFTHRHDRPRHARRHRCWLWRERPQDAAQAAVIHWQAGHHSWRQPIARERSRGGLTRARDASLDRQRIA